MNSNVRTLLLVAVVLLLAVFAYQAYESNRTGIEIRAPGVKIDTK